MKLDVVEALRAWSVTDGSPRGPTAIELEAAAEIELLRSLLREVYRASEQDSVNMLGTDLHERIARALGE